MRFRQCEFLICLNRMFVTILLCTVIKLEKKNAPNLSHNLLKEDFHVLELKFRPRLRTAGTHALKCLLRCCFKLMAKGWLFLSYIDFNIQLFYEGLNDNKNNHSNLKFFIFCKQPVFYVFFFSNQPYIVIVIGPICKLLTLKFVK